MGLNKSIQRVQKLLSKKDVNTRTQVKSLKKIIEKLEVKESALKQKIQNAKSRKDTKKLLKKVDKCKLRKKKALSLIQKIE